MESDRDKILEDNPAVIVEVEPEEVEFDFDEHIRTTINNIPKKEKEKIYQKYN